MAKGLLEVEQVEQLCTGCLVGKQRRTAFLCQAEYRAKSMLELVHSDIYGPIMPTTPIVIAISFCCLMMLADSCGLRHWQPKMPWRQRSSISRLRQKQRHVVSSRHSTRTEVGSLTRQISSSIVCSDSSRCCIPLSKMVSWSKEIKLSWAQREAC
jgi:hypothetical protein